MFLWSPCLEAIVCPATKLHVAVLVVKREPRDVDLAGWFEDAGRDVSASPGVVDHHVHRVRSIEGFVGAERDWTTLKYFESYIERVSPLVSPRKNNLVHLSHSFICEWLLTSSSLRHIPVVHQHIRLPQSARWDSYVAYVSVLRFIPLHVDVLPLL